jgi:vacuolar-type H+-ATPase subunit H
MKTGGENRKEAETRAEELVRDGQERARQALERARQDALQVSVEAESEATARAEMIRKKGLLSIQEEVADTMARGRQEADELAGRTGERTDKAAGFILRMVTGTGEK